MSDKDDLRWVQSKDEAIPMGVPGETLWVKLGWASFLWSWHPEPGHWAASDWRVGAEQESVAPGSSRRDMAWASPHGR